LCTYDTHVLSAAETTYDKVRGYKCDNIYCTSSSKVSLGERTGTSAAAFTSTTGFLLLEFVSDSSIESSGFTASWTSTVPVSMRVYIHVYIAGAALVQQGRHHSRRSSSEMAHTNTLL
jgi:hypothetical protein